MRGLRVAMVGLQRRTSPKTIKAEFEFTDAHPIHKQVESSNLANYSNFAKTEAS